MGPSGRQESCTDTGGAASIMDRTFSCPPIRAKSRELIPVEGSGLPGWWGLALHLVGTEDAGLCGGHPMDTSSVSWE